jgi:hypothetical protein
LIATWEDGLFNVAGKAVHQELEGRSVRSLTGDGRGGVLAIVDGNSLHRLAAGGQWSAMLHSEFRLSCCVTAANAVFMGTDDARVLRVDADGTQQILAAFDRVEGRGKWYAGQAIVDGKVMGPPLGIRSMSATCDGAVLLANVHVGGVPRSTDLGASWRPTIEIDADVHQVCAHPTRPGIVIAAAAVGLCISRDAGETWEIEQRGLHATHCSGVAFGRNDIYVSASADPFSAQGAVYRRPIDSNLPLQLVANGFPQWTEGKADTDCIASKNAMVAVIDMSGRLYVSHDDGATWTSIDARIPGPAGLHIC